MANPFNKKGCPNLDSPVISVFQEDQCSLLLAAAQTFAHIIMRIFIPMIITMDIIATDIIKKT